MTRFRNAAGERIRLESGARMNAEECCCDPHFVDCDAFRAWFEDFVANGGELLVDFAVTEYSGDNPCRPGPGGCGGTPNCDAWDSPIVFSSFDISDYITGWRVQSSVDLGSGTFGCTYNGNLVSVNMTAFLSLSCVGLVDVDFDIQASGTCASGVIGWGETNYVPASEFTFPRTIALKSAGSSKVCVGIGDATISVLP